VGILIVTVLLFCLDGVDYRPYFRERYYRETVNRLHARAATNAIVYGELTAGFGRAVLTPTVNAAEDKPSKGQFRALPLAGYGNRNGRPATGVHDNLHVKAVAVRVADQLGVLVSADTLIIPPEIADAASRQLSQEFGLRREQLYLSATHTHASLGGWGEGLLAESFAGKFHPGARTWFVQCIVTAVRGALTNLQPALIGHGSFLAEGFVRNRVVGELGQIDPEFSYLVIKQNDGEVAVLGSYAAHATVLSGDMMDFSGDYPGFWQTAVEQATGGTALFLAGGVGSHAPVPGERGLEGAQRMGQALAQRLIELLPHTPLTNFSAFGLLSVDVSMPPLNVRLNDGIRLRPWVAARLVAAGTNTLLQGFRLGKTVWISTPCDYSGELALGIKHLLRTRDFSAVITSFNGDYVGYVIPSRYYHLTGYEPRVMSFFGPNVPDYFDELIRAISLDLVQ
jgi:neutral ceramidase